MSVLPAALIAGPVFGLVAVAFAVAIRRCLHLRSAVAGQSCAWQWWRLSLPAWPACSFQRCLGGGPLAVILDGGYGTVFTVLLATKLCLTACIGFGLLGVFSPACLSARLPERWPAVLLR